jgi:hypothetical protein
MLKAASETGNQVTFYGRLNNKIMKFIGVVEPRSITSDKINLVDFVIES